MLEEGDFSIGVACHDSDWGGSEELGSQDDSLLVILAPCSELIFSLRAIGIGDAGISMAKRLASDYPCGSELIKFRRANIERTAEVLGPTDENIILFLMTDVADMKSADEILQTAKLAKGMGILMAVGIVADTSFNRTGKKKSTTRAQELRGYVDALCVLSLDTIKKCGAMQQDEASQLIDKYSSAAAMTICSVIDWPGYICMDFKDVRSALTLPGRFVIGLGQCEDVNDKSLAFDEALSGPWLTKQNIVRAEGLIVDFTGKKVTFELLDVIEVLPNSSGSGGDMPVLLGLCPGWEQNKNIGLRLIATGIGDWND